MLSHFIHKSALSGSSCCLHDKNYEANRHLLSLFKFAKFTGQIPHSRAETKFKFSLSDFKVFVILPLKTDDKEV